MLFDLDILIIVNIKVSYIQSHVCIIIISVKHNNWRRGYWNEFVISVNQLSCPLYKSYNKTGNIFQSWLVCSTQQGNV
jgi:hypothetical protein